MDLPFLRIESSRVEASDVTFRARSRYPDALRDSIQRNGIGTPLLVEAVLGGFRIVSGWGRWLFRPEKALVPAFLLPPESSLEALWDTFLHDNDAWNVVEVARVLRGLRNAPGLTEERIVTEKLPLLGIHASGDLYRRHLRLLDLCPEAQRFIEEENLPLRRAALFLKLPPDALERLLPMARELHFTSNEVGEVLELLEEVAQRDKVSAARVIEEMKAGTEKLTKERLRQGLRERRYPELSRYRRELASLEKQLSFSVPVRIEWDPRLERPGIRLLVDLAEGESVQKFAEELAGNREILKAFFTVL
jgi:hypothetical protein